MFLIRPSTTPAHKMFFDVDSVGKERFNANTKLPFAAMGVSQSFFVPVNELTKELRFKISLEVRKYNLKYDRVFKLIKTDYYWEVARLY